MMNSLAKNWAEIQGEFIIGIVYCSPQLQSEKKHSLFSGLMEFMCN